MGWLNQYRKTITAVVTGTIGGVTAIVASKSTGVSTGEWIMLVTIVATALGVYGVPNSEAG